jgi:adenylosuccinate synthase
MPVTVIIGGQFGSEGKGKVAHYFARESKAQIAIRVGGPNSGHTVIDKFGNPIVLKQLPTAALLPNVICVIGPGSYIDPDILVEEIRRINLPDDRLIVDSNAVIITQSELKKEKEGSLKEEIGSTLSGTGAAVISRISRNSDIKFAASEERLKPFVKRTTTFLRESLDEGKRIVVEGTQGFGLSLLHSDLYPYVTSRDTSAAAFVSEVGLSPLDVDEVVMVLRAFPIRVSGNSGPLPDEIDWDTVTQNSGSADPIIEYTSVTKKIRRVAHFDADVVRKAISVNRPTKIVLNHVDYIDSICRSENKITVKASIFIKDVENMIKDHIEYVGISPSTLISKKESYSINMPRKIA